MSLATDRPVTKASFWRKRLITFSCLHAYNYCQTQAAQGDGWIAQSENLAWMTGVQFKPPSISPTLIVQMNWLSVSKDKSNIWVICIAVHKHSPKNLAGEVFDQTVNFQPTLLLAFTPCNFSPTHPPPDITSSLRRMLVVKMPVVKYLSESSCGEEPASSVSTKCQTQALTARSKTQV